MSTMSNVRNEFDAEIDGGWILGRFYAMRPAVSYLMQVCTCGENASVSGVGRSSQTAKTELDAKKVQSSLWTEPKTGNVVRIAMNRTDARISLAVYFAGLRGGQPLPRKSDRPKLCQHAAAAPDGDEGRGNIYICLYQLACASNERLGCQSLPNALNIDGAQQW